jgi:hypothetical protein
MSVTRVRIIEEPPFILLHERGASFDFAQDEDMGCAASSDAAYYFTSS